MRAVTGLFGSLLLLFTLQNEHKLLVPALFLMSLLRGLTGPEIKDTLGSTREYWIECCESASPGFCSVLQTLPSYSFLSRLSSFSTLLTCCVGIWLEVSSFQFKSRGQAIKWRCGLQVYLLRLFIWRLTHKELVFIEVGSVIFKKTLVFSAIWAFSVAGLLMEWVERNCRQRWKGYGTKGPWLQTDDRLPIPDTCTHWLRETRNDHR